jgi:hypothetical protein
MSDTEKRGQSSPGASPAPAAAPLPPPPPRINMMATREMQEWIARLESERQGVLVRNKFLAAALIAGIVLLVAAVWGVYHATIGSYAVLDNIVIKPHPANQGRLDISFRVVSPGKVYYRRSSGNSQTDVVDYFHRAGDIERAWTWSYEPGSAIEMTLWYRRHFLRRSETRQFATDKQADVVFLLDTTESMDRSIEDLKARCGTFAGRLKQQTAECRFAVVGFGDTQEGPWLEKHEFTGDVEELRRAAAELKRFAGGDEPESALDALEEVLKLPFGEHASRQIYLATDAPYHEPSQSGATAADIAGRLAEQRLVLYVFSKAQYEENYKRLLGDAGKFQEIDDFGKALSQGRLLED